MKTTPSTYTGAIGASNHYFDNDEHHLDKNKKILICATEGYDTITTVQMSRVSQLQMNKKDKLCNLQSRSTATAYGI